jgi:biopolymer transport protein ExbD
MKRLRSTENEEQAEVMMSPLIDCVFILLIYFLVTSLLQKPHRDLGIELPAATASEQVTATYQTVIVEMATRPGSDEPLIVLEGEEVTATLLHKRLREMMVGKQPPNRARIDADEQVDVKEVMRILDLLQFEGINTVGVRTKD